jgi:protein phosphatase
MTLRLRYSVRSHVGKVRDGNEDSAYAGSRLALVADGMGGHAAGEVASSAVVATLSQLDEDDAGHDLLEILAGAVQAANDHLQAMVDANSALDGMGTTLTVLLSSGSRLGLAHVGDSRAYLLRDGEFSQLTHDQTLVQRMVDEGRITPEQAETHPQRSLLTQALDGRAGVEPDLSVREARLGDRYLLCSDGLSGYVPVEALAQALAVPDADQAAEQLIDLALRAGAPDNVTVVIADVVEDEAGLLDTPIVGGAAAEQETVPTATPAVVMPGGASLTAEERAAKRAARRRARAESEPPPVPPDEATASEQPADTGVFSQVDVSTPAEPADEVEQTPPTGMPPIVDERAGGSRRGHRRRRSWYLRPLPLTVTGLVIIVAAGILITWAVAANSWYVARDGRSVALYHGIQSAPLGVSLSSIEQRGVPFADLPPVDQQRVGGGIVADSKADGVCILARLRYNAEDAAYQQAQKTTPARRPKPTTTPKPTANPSSPPSPQASPHPRASVAPSGGAGHAGIIHQGITGGDTSVATVTVTQTATPTVTPSVAVPSPTPVPGSCPVQSGP